MPQPQTMPWSLHQLLEASGGRQVAGPAGERFFASISTDSRTIKPGELFVALAGEQHDGLMFLPKAVEGGATGALINETAATTQEVACLPPEVVVITVADTLTALGDLAAFRRRLYPGLPVLAITGSSGKTTVKEMVAAILEQQYLVLKTKGNFNNLIGLPLSLLPLDESHQVAILEMGMNHPGEIARLAAIAAPNISCIVNIHEAHLQGLGSIAGVGQAKNELFVGTPPSGILVVNLDDPLVRDLARQHHHKKITFSLDGKAAIRASHITGLGPRGTTFTLHIDSDQQPVILTVPGRHNVGNALAAAAMAHSLGVSLAAIATGLARFTPCDKRSQIETLPCGLQVINDCYNANPASMQAALIMLHDLGSHGRKIAVLGDMLELGNNSGAAHRTIGETAARLRLDYVLAFGSFAAETVEAACQQGMDQARARAFTSRTELTVWLNELIHREQLADDDWLLLKGSRSMRMETVLEALRTTLCTPLTEELP